MPALWTCARCGRKFRQTNQAHSCGTGSRAALLAGRAPALVALYRRLEQVVGGLKGVEIVHKERYALFRTTRVFADVVIMREALRLAVVLDRREADPRFVKVASMKPGRVGHVMMLRSAQDVRGAARWVRQAHRLSLQEPGRAEG